MKQFHTYGGWLGVLLLGTSTLACSSGPTCEDLANCTTPTGSSGSGSSSGSSSGAMVMPEDCTNGADDDKDGSIDCADSECSDKHTCLPAIPAGFTEVVTITAAPYGEALAACPGGAMPKPFYQNPASNACDACTCDASGVTCSGPDLLISAGFFDMDCNQVQPAGPLPPGQCQPIFTPAAMVQGTPTMTGTCTTNATGGPLKPPMETTIATCAVGNINGRGCGMSGTCVASAGLMGAEHTCIKKAGHNTCPGEWPLAFYAFESFTDDRKACDTCSCTATCTGGKYTIFPEDQTCANGGVVVDPAGACTQAGGFSNGVLFEAPVASCTVNGGQTNGSVLAMDETTFCCF